MPWVLQNVKKPYDKAKKFFCYIFSYFDLIENQKGWKAFDLVAAKSE